MNALNIEVLRSQYRRDLMNANAWRRNRLDACVICGRRGSEETFASGCEGCDTYDPADFHAEEGAYHSSDWKNYERNGGSGQYLS